MGLLRRATTEPSESTSTKDNLGVDWVIVYDFTDIGEYSVHLFLKLLHTLKLTI